MARPYARKRKAELLSDVALTSLGPNVRCAANPVVKRTVEKQRYAFRRPLTPALTIFPDTRLTKKLCL